MQLADFSFNISKFTDSCSFWLSAKDYQLLAAGDCKETARVER